VSEASSSETFGERLYTFAISIMVDYQFNPRFTSLCLLYFVSVSLGVSHSLVFKQVRKHTSLEHCIMT
jgi:hypothetical protein